MSLQTAEWWVTRNLSPTDLFYELLAPATLSDSLYAMWLGDFQERLIILAQGDVEVA